MGNFMDLRVWQRSKELAVYIYQLTSLGKFVKDYSLRDQMRRASVSISSNTCPVQQLENMMHYTYVLQSTKDKNFYVGFTKNLKLRFEQHSNGFVESTKDRRPFVLIYYEACINKNDARQREKYLK